MPVMSGVVMHLEDKSEDFRMGYLAGIFDGEGCVTIASRQRGHGPVYTVVASVSNYHFPVLLGFEQTFGGKVYRGGDKVSRWATSNAVAETFLRKIRPYVWIKAEQIDVVLEWREATLFRTRCSRNPELRAVRHQENLATTMAAIDQLHSIRFNLKETGHAALFE